MPFVIASGVERWFHEVPKFLVQEFKDWRNIDMLVPTMTKLADAWTHRDRSELSQAGLRLVYASMPFIFAFGGLLLAGFRLWARRGLPRGQDVLAFSISLLAITMLNQVRVRPAIPQEYPAFVASLPLIGYLLTVILSGISVRINRWAGNFLVAVCLIAVSVYFVQTLTRAFSIQSLKVFQVERAGYVFTGPTPQEISRATLYAELIGYIENTTAPDEYIFSGVQDTSRLFINDALIYFLANRRSATRWIEMEAGLTNTERGQAEIINELKSKSVKTIVLFNALSTEPNATARSNGVHSLDDFLHDNYRETKRFGDYVVLRRNDT